MRSRSPEQSAASPGERVLRSALMNPFPDAPGLHSGVDLVAIARVADVLDRHGDRFLNRVYTAREQDYCGDRVHELAARFAAKESVMKALGTGVRGVGWREVEILANARGKPIVLLHGRARARANHLGFRSIEISMTHEREIACAFAVALGEGAHEQALGEGAPREALGEGAHKQALGEGAPREALREGAPREVLSDGAHAESTAPHRHGDPV